MTNLKIKWAKVLDYNNIDQPPLIEWIDLGNGTMFRIFAFFSHGGTQRPRRGLVVGIERKGSFFFSLENKIYYDYVEEKLNLQEPDARAIADWMNVQLGHDVPQQGIYYPNYINGFTDCNLMGENYSTPLIPEIIK